MEKIMIDEYRGVFIYLNKDNTYMVNDSVVGHFELNSLEKIKNKIDNMATKGNIGIYKPDYIINNEQELNELIYQYSSYNNEWNYVNFDENTPRNQFPKLFNANISIDNHFNDSCDEIPANEFYRYRFNVQTSLFDNLN